MKGQQRQQSGFSLIEILIALTILTVAIAGVATTVSQFTLSTKRKQDTVYAQFVAMNKIAELRLQRNWPNTGRANGIIELAKRKWYWETEIKNTPDKDVRRLVIKVMLESQKDDGPAMATMVAFLGRPVG